MRITIIATDMDFELRLCAATAALAHRVFALRRLLHGADERLNWL